MTIHGGDPAGTRRAVVQRARGIGVGHLPACLRVLLLLVLVGRALPAFAAPPHVEKALAEFQGQRDRFPLFEESFTTDLRQWGLPTPLGPDGLVLDRARGSVPGARQIFIPGLLLKEGILSCELCLSPEDQGYLAFRLNEEEDNGYQFLITSRLDGSHTTGFVKKHNLEQLYGGGRVGQSFRAAYPAGEWLRVTLYFRDKKLVATVNGEPAAYYDRAEARDGAISLFAGAKPLRVRDLSVWSFQGNRPASPYRLAYAEREPVAEPRRVARPAEALPGFAPAAAPLPALPPEPCADGVEGTLEGAQGVLHLWHLTEEGRFFLDGEELVPLRDTDGLYFAAVPGDVSLQRAVESLRDGALLNRIRTAGLPYVPVRVRLKDYVNALDTDHEFGEDPVLDGRSRLQEINGRRYRVTSPRRWLSYFAYTVHTDAPLAPHLLLAEAPNDRERALVLRTQPPDGSGGDPEYGVGAGTYTGRGIPTNGRPFSQTLLFRPRTEAVRLTVSRMPIEDGRDVNYGAAVSQIFLFELADSPAERPNPVLPPEGAPERTLALALPSAKALLRQCGAGLESAQATPEDRAAGYRAFLYHLRFLGFNALDLGVLDLGADGLTAEYPGSRVLSRCLDRGIFSTLLPMAAEAGVRVTPVIPALPCCPQLAPGGRAPEEWSLVDREGRTCHVGPWPALDPLHPDVARRLSDLVAEISRLCGSSAPEIALRVDGDLGGCLPRGEGLSAAEVGYNAETLARFQIETGVAVPLGSAAEAYRWLRENAWERWIDWRCESLTEQWLRLRNLLRLEDPERRLLLKLALPDRGQARPYAWFRDKAPILDLMRAHGFDPRAFAEAEGICLERAFDVGYDRARSFHHLENVGALDSFSYQSDLRDLYQTAEPAAVEISLAPWEESGQRLGSEFYPRAAGQWGAATVTPWGRHLFRPITRALREGNPYRISLSAVEFATAGREADWRRFARAYRALPAMEPEPVEGEVLLCAPLPAKTPPTPKLPDDLRVARFGARIGVVNDSGQARRIELRPARPLEPGERWVDLATGLTLATTPNEPILLDVDAYDLRVLAVLPR